MNNIPKFDEPQACPIDGASISAADLLDAFVALYAGQDEPIMRIWIGDVTAGGAVFPVKLFDSEDMSGLSIVETGASARPDDIEAGKAWAEESK